MQAHCFHLATQASVLPKDLVEVPNKTIVLVFGPPSLSVECPALSALTKAFPRSPIIGTSGCGSILGSRIHNEGLVITIIQLEQSSFKVMWANDSKESAAGAIIGKSLWRSTLKGILLLANGTTHPDVLVHGLNLAIRGRVPIVGGLSGASAQHPTWVLRRKELFSWGAVGIGFYGEHLQFDAAAGSGWSRDGSRIDLLQATKTSEGRIEELNGHRALPVFLKAIGGEAWSETEFKAHLPRLSLAVGAPVKGQADVLRMPLEVDFRKGTFRLLGDTQAGTFLTPCRATPSSLIASTRSAVSTLARNHPGPGLFLALNSCGRRNSMGAQASDELEAMASGLPKGSTMAGFYTYGEFGSGPNGASFLNYTSMVARLWEGPF